MVFSLSYRLTPGGCQNLSVRGQGIAHRKNRFAQIYKNLNKPHFHSFLTIIKEIFGRLTFYTYFCRKEVASRNPYYDSRLLGQELPFHL